MHTTLLRILGFVFVIFGVGYAMSPLALMEATGLSGTAAGVTDVRATYGGFQIGFGAFMILAAGRPDLVRVALFAAALVVGAVAVCRGAGMLIDGAPSTANLSAMVFEVGVAALAFWLHGRAPAADAAVN